MISNSRLVTKDISFGSESPASTKVADRYSDNLMDDLFSDVDQILAGDLSSAITVSAQSHSARPHSAQSYRNVTGPASSSARTVTLPADFSPQSAADIYRATVAASSHGGGRPVTTTARTAAASSETALPLSESPEADDSPVQSVSNSLYPQDSPLALISAGGSPPSPQTIFQPRQLKKQVSLPFLLIGAVGISLMSTFGLWMINRSAPEPRWLFSLSKEATAAELPSRSDQAFLDYLGQSLKVISAGKAGGEQVATVPPSPAGPETAAKVSALPVVPSAKPSTNPIERVFVPVYQNGQQTAQSASQPAARLSVSLPVVPAPPAPTATSRTAPSVPRRPAASTTLPSPGASTGASTAVAPTNSATAALTDVTPAADHVLVGVLKLGDRSAAMFNIDGGSSQRAYVGDRIGLSSWTLVTVNGQDVVVRRDGEVRSIYIGQSF